MRTRDLAAAIALAHLIYAAVRYLFISVVLYLLTTSATLAQSALPDPAKTPGALNPEVTQATIGSTICVSGWTRTVRPASAYTSALKRQQMREYGYADRRMSDFEEDHLVPLVLGGAPYDPRNLWPEPRATADGWTASVKDDLEAALGRQVCSGRVPLAEAQQAIATDWIAAYKRFVAGD